MAPESDPSEIRSWETSTEMQTLLNLSLPLFSVLTQHMTVLKQHTGGAREWAEQLLRNVPISPNSATLRHDYAQFWCGTMDSLFAGDWHTLASGKGVNQCTLSHLSPRTMTQTRATRSSSTR